MKESLFVVNNQKTWHELEELLKSYKLTGNPADYDKLHRLFELYRLVCGHLSIARTRYGNTGTVEYLNNLAARAHQVIYASRPGNISGIIHFLLKGFPALIRKEYSLLLISAGIFILSFLFSFITVLKMEDYALSFIPAEYADAVRNSAGNAQELNNTVASVAIFTNNIQVGILAFALGITFGTGTVYVLAKNGILLGALSAVAVNAGTGFTFWSLILPHGILNYSAFLSAGRQGLQSRNQLFFRDLIPEENPFQTAGRKH